MRCKNRKGLIMKLWPLLIIPLILFSCNKEVTKTSTASNSEKVYGEKIRISGKNIKKGNYKKLIISRNMLRAYEGAPPRIPHGTKGQIAQAECLNCHSVGTGHGPNVLHAHLSNCTQCHVSIKTSVLFKANDFSPLRQRSVKRESNPIGPPYIPHRIQNRKNCNICHTAAGAKEELIPRHGELDNCLQCHVKRQEVHGEFSRN